MGICTLFGGCVRLCTSCISDHSEFTVNVVVANQGSGQLLVAVNPEVISINRVI